MAKLKITQVRSKNGETKRQIANLKTLGIRRMHQTVEVEDTPITRGMLAKVAHPAKGATHNSKRVGRGQGSGKGGTATRGTKGAQARAGYEHKVGFEGGQMPIQRRLPKFGFKNPTRVAYKAVNVATIQALSEKLGVKAFDTDTFIAAGIASKGELVKVLGNGELTAAVEVKANAFSASATQKIEAAGGKAIVIE